VPDGHALVAAGRDHERSVPQMHDGEFIICSDAGAPLATGCKHGPLKVFRLKRVADILLDQSRSLRVRAFAHYLHQTPSGGAYIYINTPISAPEKCPSVQFAASFPTTLRRLDLEEFDRLAAHGQAEADKR
jgi:NTE family protein